MSLHAVDNRICVCVCHPICLSVENVSVTTMVPTTPTTQPITSHPTTSILPPPRFGPEPKGNAHAPFCSFVRMQRDSNDLQEEDHAWVSLFVPRKIRLSFQSMMLFLVVFKLVWMARFNLFLQFQKM